MQRELQPTGGSSRALAHDSHIPRARPFHLRVEQSVLDDLRLRLARTRWSHVPHATDWDRGTRRSFLRELVRHWRDGYDWRYHEVRIDAMPQFMARVDETDLHFVHVKARDRRATRATPTSPAIQAQAMPLLMLHGWPDSFYRFHKVVPTLSNFFDVVVPSLPGFGFTRDRMALHDQSARRTATLLWHLMTDVLGYQRFGVAGGDTGSAVAQILAIDHPASVIGIHLTDIGWHALNVEASSLSRSERRYLAASKKAFMADGAYVMVQTTRPRALAPQLTDSPVGLASWIVDRFHSWSDGDLDARFGKDDLLTNIMLYWVTETIGSSMFCYHAEAKSPSLRPTDRVERPVGLALFPHDIGGVPPRSFAERTLDVKRWTEMPRGGHFAPLEEPELYVGDVMQFFRLLTAQSGASP